MIDAKEIRNVVATTGDDQYPIIPLCDYIDELERKLKIAEDALNEIRKADQQSEEEFNPSEDMEKALDGVIIALKQIQGDTEIEGDIFSF